MKTLVLAVLIMASGWCWGETDYNVLADTTFLHDLKLIDEHMVITDTVIIEKTIIKFHEADSKHNLLAPLVAFFTAGLVLLSLISHYLKTKNNGTKIH
jgi:hypothetical protein